MRRPIFVLIHSPLTPPWIWLAVADALAARGHGVVAPNLEPLLDGCGSYYFRCGDETAPVIDDVSGPEGVVLVAHSGAG
jgi:hypothetical protein